MTQLLLILLGLFSNASSSNPSNCGGDGSTPNIVQPNSTTPPTGGDDGHPVPPKIIGG